MFRNIAAIAFVLASSGFMTLAGQPTTRHAPAVTAEWRKFELLPLDYAVNAHAAGEIRRDGDYIYFKVSSIALKLNKKHTSDPRTISGVRIGLVNDLGPDRFETVADSATHNVGQILSTDGTLTLPAFETRIPYRGRIPADTWIYLSVLMPDPRAASDPRAAGLFAMVHAFESGAPVIPEVPSSN